ncbi:MAG: inositol monophosphatase family protein [Pseudomonadota bacterium]
MSFDDKDLGRLLDLLRTSAKAEVLPRYRALSDGETEAKTAPDDLVTVADTGMEQAVADGLARDFPDIELIGEEAVHETPALLSRIGAAARSVILDPIDGTWNFAHGMPAFGVIAAVVERGETVAGIIYDPVWDDCVLARRGAGAWRQAPDGTRTPLAVAAPAPLAEMGGYVAPRLHPATERAGLFACLTGLHRVQSLRCSAWEYRALASGAMAFGLTALLKPWDHAAGVLIHAEAGGVSRLLDGTPYNPTLTEGPMLSAPDEASWAALAEHFLTAAPGLVMQTTVS